MDSTNSVGYSGYPDTNKWSAGSKQLGAASQMLSSYITQNIINDNPLEIDRITKYYLYWNFYEGKHYKDYNDAMLSFNYIRAFIDKVNMFLLGKDGFTFHTKSYSSDVVEKDFEDVAEKFVMQHWNKNKKASTAYEMFQMGSVCGDLWISLTWDDLRKFVKIKTLDSRQCFPYFNNGDYDDLNRFVVRIPLEVNKNVATDRNKDVQPYRLQCIEFTATTISKWKQKTLAHLEKDIEKFEQTSEDNPYGFIPIVHIKNKPSPGYYSKSDATDILKINKIYNEMLQEQKAVIDYHATPTTVITGGTAKNLRRGLGNIWSGLPPEANVFNLALDFDMSSTSEFIAKLKVGMHELSDVPESALGKAQQISNTSAAALQITYQPLLQQADMKGITYGDGITEINYMLVKMTLIMDPENKYLIEMEKLVPDFEEEIRIEPVFSYGFPQDKQADLNMGLSEINAKIGSRREIMQRLGKNNIPQLLEEIDEDYVKEQMLQGEVQSAMMPQDDGSGGQNNSNN